ncbi:MAG: polysaccharide biosynthesis C-terminal domain-containing protein [Clostridia bacterium]|nr:polysaccharide biosynthesis C-terminal domain-containing protein [Clostridia bacterium]
MPDKRRRINLFFGDPDLSMLLKMFFPIFADMLLNNFIGTIHAYFVSNAGETVISAISLVNQVNDLIATVFFSACSATMVIVAQQRGMGKLKEAVITVGQTMFFAVYGTALLAVVFSLFPSQIMTLFFGQMDPLILVEANKYIPLLGISLPFYCVFQVSACSSRAFDNHRIPLFISVSGSIVNVLLAYILITLCDLGIVGAGISLIISRIASGIFGYAFLTKLKWIAPFKDSVRVRFKNIKSVLSLGLYNSIANLIAHYAGTLKTGFLVPFGISHITASSIFGSFSGLLSVPTAVINTMVTTLVARNLSLNDKPRAIELLKKCLAYSIIINIFVYSVAYFILPHFFVSYTDNSQTLELLDSIILITCLFTPVITTFVGIMAHTFNSAGDARFSTVVNIGCMLIFNLGFGYIFAVVLELGVLGSFLSTHLSALIKAIIFAVRYKSGKWIKTKV